MATEDDFEIDLYGDSTEPQAEAVDTTNATINDSNALDDDIDYNDEPSQPAQAAESVPTAQLGGTSIQDRGDQDMGQNRVEGQGQNIQSSTSAQPTSNAPTPTTQQGTKRKEAPDDVAVDPGASNALIMAEVNWWTTDDDVRGWANLCGFEDELREVGFNEYKINGKSKGQVYVEFDTPKAASTMKRYIETTLAESSAPARGFQVSYSTTPGNPYKAFGKDTPRNATNAPGRGNFNANDRAGAYSSFGARGKPGMGMRGNFNNNRGNFNQGGGYNMSGYQGNNMNNMGFQGNRGGMMQMGGMRGGNMNRGRGNFGQMGMNGMNNMSTMNNMGGMMPNMGMANGFGGMGMMGGFGAAPQGYVNPAFFGGQQMGGGDWNNPHGAKRPRGE